MQSDVLGAQESVQTHPATMQSAYPRSSQLQFVKVDYWNEIDIIAISNIYVFIFLF